MTKQSVVVPAEMTVATPPNTAALFPYPPPRAMPGVAVRKKYLQAQMELPHASLRSLQRRRLHLGAIRRNQSTYV